MRQDKALLILSWFEKVWLEVIQRVVSAREDHVAKVKALDPDP